MSCAEGVSNTSIKNDFCGIQKIFCCPAENVSSFSQVGLEILLMLTLTTANSASQQKMAAVSYTKASDIWSFACLFMVFAAMVETILQSYVETFSQMRKPLAQRNGKFQKELTQPTIEEQSQSNKEIGGSISSSFVFRNCLCENFNKSHKTISCVFCRVGRKGLEEGVTENTPYISLVVPSPLPGLQSLLLAQIHSFPPATPHCLMCVALEVGCDRTGIWARHTVNKWCQRIDCVVRICSVLLVERVLFWSLFVQLL